MTDFDEMRTRALELACDFPSSSPTPSPEEVVARAQAYFEFLVDRKSALLAGRANEFEERSRRHVVKHQSNIPS